MADDGNLGRGKLRNNSRETYEKRERAYRERANRERGDARTDSY